MERILTRRRVLRAAALSATALVLVVVVTACGDSDSGSQASSSSGGGLPKGTYTIGYAASLTGWLSTYDKPCLDGMNVRINDINKAGGVDGKLKLKIVTRDSKSTPAGASVAAKDLMGQKPNFGIAPADLDVGLPAGQVFTGSKVPNLLACSNGYKYPKILGKYAFTSQYGTAVMGSGMAQYALKKGYKTACDYSSNDFFYAKNISDTFDKVFQEGGGKIVCHLYYHLTDTDFRTVATQIAAKKPDVVATSLLFPGATTFLKQTRAAGYKGPLVWGDGIDATAALGAGSALNGVTFATSACPTKPKTAEFYKAFTAATGKPPVGGFVTNGADVIDLLNQALLKAKSTDPDKVAAAFASLSDVDGTSSKITYPGAPFFHVPKKDVHMLEWVNGKRVCRDEFFPTSIPK